jgi:hypothetical protein
MQTTLQPIRTSTLTLWTGRTLSALAILFLAFDGVIKILQLAPAVEATTQLGYPANFVFGLGALELLCLALYLFPRTSALGAILLTGYFGGAIATQLSNGSALFSLVFPIILGLFVWGGLFLRDKKLRALMSLRS